METPEEILPALDDLPLPTLRHYMGQFGVEVPQTRATRAECAALLRARLEALVHAPPRRAPPAPRARRLSLPAPAPVVTRSPVAVVADSGANSSDDDEEHERKERQKHQERRARPVTSRSARAAPRPAPDLPFPAIPTTRPVVPQAAPQAPPALVSAPAPVVRPQQRRPSPASARKLALGLLGVAGVLLAVAAALWAQDVFAAQRDSSTGVTTSTIMTSEEAVGAHEGVARVCAAVATLLAEQRWLAAHCGGDGSVADGALTVADVRRALQLAGTLRQADLPAFETAAHYGFCTSDDSDGADACTVECDSADACTVECDSVRCRSTAPRAVLLSWCAVAVAWEHSRRLVALAAAAGVLAAALSAVRRRNRARTASAARVAAAAVRELQRAAAQSVCDGSAPYRTEDALRAAAAPDVDAACWAQALAGVRHTRGVEREQRLLAGRSECVLRWCAPVPGGL